MNWRAGKEKTIKLTDEKERKVTYEVNGIEVCENTTYKHTWKFVKRESSR